MRPSRHPSSEPQWTRWLQALRQLGHLLIKYNQFWPVYFSCGESRNGSFKCGCPSFLAERDRNLTEAKEIDFDTYVGESWKKTCMSQLYANVGKDDFISSEIFLNFALIVDLQKSVEAIIWLGAHNVYLFCYPSKTELLKTKIMGVWLASCHLSYIVAAGGPLLWDWCQMKLIAMTTAWRMALRT